MTPAGGRGIRWAGVLAFCLAALMSRAAIDDVLRSAAELERSGRFHDAEQVLSRALGAGGLTEEEQRTLDFERDRFPRIRRDFPLTREQLAGKAEESVRDLAPAEFAAWVEEGRFDHRVIDGEERFSASSLSNLYFRHPELEARRKKPRDSAAVQLAHWENAAAIRGAARAAGSAYVLPRTFQVTMTLTVAPGAVAPGEMISAWLPLPRRFPHQDGFFLQRSVPALVGADALAPEDSSIRSIWLRQPAASAGPTEFRVEYEYIARGVSFDLDPSRWTPLPSASAASMEIAPFLREAPHVVFSPEMRALAERVGGAETNAVRRARRFYEWIAANVRYSYAPEYSTLRNVAEKCRADGHGDCGQTALLFMTLCRLSGIPARWQSGWSIFPGDETIHDWCEIRLEPWGWVPVDPYMGVYATHYTPALNPGQRQELRDFYFGGLTQYRMAANADHSRALVPAKRSIRSDDVDFQRGEVEAGGRNLFFDRWDYDLRWKELSAPGESAPAWFDVARVRQLTERALTGTRALARLGELCDGFGPRFSGTTNLESAIDWLIERWREDGFENVRGEPVQVPRWVRGRESLELVDPLSPPTGMPLLGLGGSTNTPPEGLTAPVLVVTNFTELTARAAEASGRIVLFNAAFSDYGNTVRYRTRGASEAAKAGAVAALVRSVTPFSLQSPHTGMMVYDDGVRRVPVAAITVEDAERLARFQARGLTPTVRLRMEARTLPDVTSRNVIAEWRGRERPQEIIVVGGHIDSWDVGQGALDDGGGCLAAWEAVRLIRESGMRPRRTLRIVFWVNEENGLRGARAYPEQHRDELDRHVVAIESDSGVGPVSGFGFTGSERANAQLREIVPFLRELRADRIKAGAGGADLGPLLQAGVPTMDLWTDRRDYFWFHHSAADTVDKVSREELNRCVAALAVMLYGLAEMPEPLAR